MEENNEKLNISIFIIPIIAILIASSIYFIYINSFNGFDQTSQRFTNVLNILENLPENSNLFIGDSQTREDIDCNLISESCYNLAVEGILPIQLSLINKEIIKAKPKNVIIGISPLFFSEYINKNDDLFFIISENNIIPDEEAVKFLNKDEEKLISMNWLKRGLYKRKFILPFYLSLLKGSYENKEIKTNNFKNPNIFNENIQEQELINKINKGNITELFNNTKQREIDSFKYLIKKLKENNIKVTIIEMPINPLLNKEYKEFSKLISEISKENKADYLDLSNSFNKDEFIDLTHLNEKGRNKLSNKIKGEKNVIQ